MCRRADSLWIAVNCHKVRTRLGVTSITDSGRGRLRQLRFYIWLHTYWVSHFGPSENVYSLDMVPLLTISCQNRAASHDVFNLVHLVQSVQFVSQKKITHRVLLACSPGRLIENCISQPLSLARSTNMLPCDPRDPVCLSTKFPFVQYAIRIEPHKKLVCSDRRQYY